MAVLMKVRPGETVAAGNAAPLGLSTPAQQPVKQAHQINGDPAGSVKAFGHLLRDVGDERRRGITIRRGPEN
jgi:hypothetical protein